MVDLQYQVLTKCVSSVKGARKELFREIAGVESPRMALDAAQARLLGKMMRDATTLGDLWSGPGLPVYPAEVEEGTNWEGGRSWKDCGEQWQEAESDGFISVISCILNKAAEVGDGDEGLSIGGRIEKGEIPEVKLQANKDLKADKWELVISEAREESIGVFTNSSMSEEGRVGSGWHVEGLAGSKEGMGKLAMVWDGEIAGMQEGIQMAPEDHKILLLSDSQAAIAAI